MRAVPSPVRAIEVSATRRSLLRRWIVTTFVAIAASTALVGGGWLAWSSRSASQWRHDGTLANATVVSIASRQVGRPSYAEGSIVVRFSVGDSVRVHDVYVGRRVVDYQVLQQVTVVYDAGEPKRVALAGVRVPGRGVPVAVATAFGLLLGAVALLMVRQARRVARVVRREPWQVVDVDLVEVPMFFGLRQRARTVAVLKRERGLIVEPTGLSHLDPGFAPIAWMAEDSAGRIVLAYRGGGHVIPVRRRPIRAPETGE